MTILTLFSSEKTKMISFDLSGVDRGNMGGDDVKFWGVPWP